MNINEFKEVMGLTEIPTELEKLIDFQNNISYFGGYSECFGVGIDDKSGLKTWSEESSFLDKLYPFAQANGSGSTYAIWNDGTNKTINEMPIVVFGDEGGVHVVAENMLQLLHLLTFDTEISVDFDSVYFYKDEDDYEESEDLNKFIEWLKEDYGLKPIKNDEETHKIIDTAKDKYQDKLNAFLTGFGIEI